MRSTLSCSSKQLPSAKHHSALPGRVSITPSRCPALSPPAAICTPASTQVSDARDVRAFAVILTKKLMQIQLVNRAFLVPCREELRWSAAPRQCGARLRRPDHCESLYGWWGMMIWLSCKIHLSAPGSAPAGLGHVLHGFGCRRCVLQFDACSRQQSWC
jgi:hypothetical protein